MKRSRLERRTPPPRGGRIKPKKRSAKEFRRIYGSVARVQWIAARPCVGCGRGPCEGHHIANDGISRKAHHSLIVPLCERCHDELHDHGALTFELAHRVCLAVEAERTHKAWYEYERGQPFHAAPE